MSTESKRRWRANNPERSDAYERKRAQARRSGWWGAEHMWKSQPDDARECASSESYYRYEMNGHRYLSRLQGRIAQKEARLEENGFDVASFLRSLDA